MVGGMFGIFGVLMGGGIVEDDSAGWKTAGGK